MLFKVHERYAVAARVRDSPNLNFNHRTNTRTGCSGKPSDERIELWRIFQDGPARAVESNNTRRSRKSAEHNHDATIFLQVGDRLDPTTCLVEISNSAWPGHEKLVTVALGRAVQRTVTGEWCRGDEEDGLRFKPLGQLVTDALEGPSHATIMAVPR